MKASVVQKISNWVLAGVLALVPFHAFLTVWAGSVFGGYTAWRLWPEVGLVLLGGYATCLLIRDKQLRQGVSQNPIAWCIVAYILLHISLGLWALATRRVTGFALADGLVLNLRLPLFFAAAWVIGSQSDWLRQHWRWLLLVPAALVVIFGLLQVFVLPADFLRQFGYGPHTIAPFETVDQKASYVRAQSFLRGANPLGAYLVIVLAALAAIGWRKRSRQVKLALASLSVGAAIVLAYTYSRSAYIGVVAALLAAALWPLKSAKLKKIGVGLVAVLLVFGAGLFFALRHNDHFQNTFFHSDEHSQSAHSSNQQRARAIKNGLHDLVRQPLGNGPGTAGPASVHNAPHPVRIAENYYLQLGQEVGLLGLGLFVTINLLIARNLWKIRTQPLGLMLLASLLGLTIINLLSHAWTDDTLAIIWWSLAGIALALPRTSFADPIDQRGGVRRGSTRIFANLPKMWGGPGDRTPSKIEGSTKEKS